MEAEVLRPKAVLVTEDCFAAAVCVFMQSSKWTDAPPEGYSDATKELWGRELRRAAHPNGLGAVSLQEIRPSLVQAYLDGIEGRPSKKLAAYAAIKVLEKWAVVRDVFPRQITIGIELARPKSGHVPWTDEQVALAERHLRPLLARAITLASNTGQRGSDLIRMGPTDLETYEGIDGINVLQKKTGKRIWIPITAPLAVAMKTWERRPGPFLITRWGGPWARKALSHAWKIERNEDPNLKPLKAAKLVLHGLRGTACVRLKRAGATAIQIADMVGMSVEMVERYCRFSDQRANASAAVYHLSRTIHERSSTGPLRNANK